MWQQINLRMRVYVLTSVLIATTLAGGATMIWYTYQFEHRMAYLIDTNIDAYHAAEGLENALINQKGYVSYYFMDGDPLWLRQLGEYRQIFKVRLSGARNFILSDKERATLNRIEDEYRLYIAAKDLVISHYEAGQREAGAALHPEVRKRFFNILERCAEYKEIQKQKALVAKEKTRSQAKRLRIIALAAIVFEILVGVGLAFVLIGQILMPIRRLAMEATGEGNLARSANVIQALSTGVKGLMADINQAHSMLEKSQENLMQSEKMAMVGKLAAGMAHSIRNPFTSVTMRLFSLRRTLQLTETQREDFDVISNEIRHIDTIVQNFLEFARPPKLQVQQVSPSSVVDATLQLLSHRLNSYDVTVDVQRDRALPELDIDAEQVKEVLVNLVVNACEAMGHGGSIIIRENETADAALGRVAVIAVIDTGPGIAESVLEKVQQPFFTTKDEGTGLGLSIAQRIMHEHGGRMDVVSTEGKGATVTLTFPVKE